MKTIKFPHLLIKLIVAMKLLIELVVILGLCLPSTLQEGCVIADFYSLDSVLLSTDFNFLYPPFENLPDNRTITLPIGTTILISCNGGHFSSLFSQTKTIQATCNQKLQFEAQDTIFDFDSLNCVNFKPITIKFTPYQCAPNAVFIQLGFQIGVNITFQPITGICFDTEKLITLYVNFNITRSIGFAKSYLVTDYIVDSVFDNTNVDFDNLYGNLTFQQQTINKLLGLDLNSTEYLNPDSCKPPGGASTPGFCFSKRPLVNRQDFVYITQQYAAYRYINIVPQWYFLDYNLNKLERNIIDYIKANYLDLEIYSGTYGIVSLPHAVTGEEIPLFLNNGTISVPLLFWKIIYDSLRYRATVFLTVNNPYQSIDEISKNVICDDISDEITWLTWEKHNITKGYSYACRYDDVKTVIDYLPFIYVKDILA